MSATAAPPRMSIIIPHLNQPEALAACLNSLAIGAAQPDEVFVVDNGSKELPHAVCDAAGATLLQEPEPGPGPARNTGVAASTGEILACIDADCLSEPGWIADFRARFTAASPPEIAGGDVRIAWRTPPRLTDLEAYESVYAYRMDRYIARENFTGTGNLATWRRIYDQVGPFAGIGVAEDRDWGQRAHAKGYRITYLADMKVYHPAREAFAELCKKWDRQSAHDYKRNQTRSLPAIRWLARTGAIAVSPLAEVPRILNCDRISGMGTRWQAWRCLLKIRLYRARIMLEIMRTGDPDRLSGGWNRGS